MTFHLGNDEGIAPGLKRIALEQVEHALFELSDKNKQSPLVQVHQFRKRCKKLRGLLRLMKPALVNFQEQDTLIRDAARLLTQVRDQQVMDQTLSARSRHPELVALDPDIVSACLDKMDQVKNHVECWPLENVDRTKVAKAFRHTHARLRRTFRRAHTEPTTEHYHKVRKWAKYEWYQTRILERIDTKHLSPRRKLLREIGEDLGDVHDIAMILNRPSHARGIDAALTHRLKQTRVRLLDSATRDLDAITRTKPRRLEKWIQTHT